MSKSRSRRLRASRCKRNLWNQSHSISSSLDPNALPFYPPPPPPLDCFLIDCSTPSSSLHGIFTEEKELSDEISYNAALNSATPQKMRTLNEISYTAALSTCTRSTFAGKVYSLLSGGASSTRARPPRFGHDLDELIDGAVCFARGVLGALQEEM